MKPVTDLLCGSKSENILARYLVTGISNGPCSYRASGTVGEPNDNETVQASSSTGIRMEGEGAQPVSQITEGDTPSYTVSRRRQTYDNHRPHVHFMPSYFLL